MTQSISFTQGETRDFGPNVQRTRKGRFGAGAITLTDAQWTQAIQVLAEGGTYEEAYAVAGCGRRAFEANMRINPDMAKEVIAARTAARRSAWSLELVEEILAEVAAGKMVTEVVKSKGKDPGNFMRVILEDESLTEMFKRAKLISANVAMEDVLAIADDDSNDLDLTGKGNMAAVNRSKLRTETRFKVAQAYDPRTFQQGKTEVNVAVQVNHAAQLEEARHRRDKRIATVTPASHRAHEVTEAEYSVPSLPPPDASAPEVSTTLAPEAGGRPSWDDI